MKSLHIVQAGIDNGDYTWLKRAAKTGAHSKSWVVPKNSKIGDVVVLFVRSLGFVATAQIMSAPLKRDDWANRYGSAIGAIELIEPPLSLAYIQSSVPDLTIYF